MFLSLPLGGQWYCLTSSLMTIQESKFLHAKKREGKVTLLWKKKSSQKLGRYKHAPLGPTFKLKWGVGGSPLPPTPMLCPLLRIDMFLDISWVLSQNKDKVILCGFFFVYLILCIIVDIKWKMHWCMAY